MKYPIVFPHVSRFSALLLSRYIAFSLAGVFALSFTTTGYSSGEANEAPLTLPRLSVPPVIDGSIEESEWDGALAFEPLSVEEKAPNTPATQVWMALSDLSLFVAIRCDEPKPAKIKTVTIPDENDGDVQQDDHLHLIFDMENTPQRDLFELLVNSQGTLHHGKSRGLHYKRAGWSSGAKVRTHVGERFWEVEMEIPLSAFGHYLQKGEVIGFNIGRTRHTSRPELSQLKAPFNRHIKSLVPLLVEDRLQANGLAITATSRGPFSKRERGEWRFDIDADQPSEILVRWPSHNNQIEKHSLVKGKQVLSLPFTGEQVDRKHRIELLAGDTPLYRSHYTVIPEAELAQVPATVDPLFEELLEFRPEGLSSEGFIAWRHDFEGASKALANGKTFRQLPLAQRIGREYSIEDTFQKLGESKAIVIAKVAPHLTPEFLELANRHKVRWAAYPGFKDAHRRGAPLFGGKTIWALDPRAIEAYLDEARHAIKLAKTEPSIWGIFAGDEAFEELRSGFRWALNSKDPYPEFDAANEEVKKRFGFGKYGFPKSLKDTNPYRWIATARWENEQMLKIQAKVREMIQAECPRLKHVSWDPQSRATARNYRQWGKMFDIMTAQASREQGFLTKIMHDLSGADEVWMCAHVEHYKGNYTPAEAEEVLSEIVRNGGTGLHLYSADVVNNRRGKGSPLVERIGAPDRWAVQESVLERLQKRPFRVKQPESDTAVFFSNLSYIGKGEHPNPNADDLEGLYHIMGTQLHQAFSFIDEDTCEEEAARLKQYKAIYIPYAPIVDDATYDVLVNYVAEGGTVIVCDPLAFRNRSDGSKRRSGALQPPVQFDPKSGVRELKSSLITEQLDPLNVSFALNGEGHALAHYEDDDAAILETAYKEGKVIFFGHNPLGAAVAKNDGWVALFSALQQRMGATKSPAWRFRFPETPIPTRFTPEGVCFTANGVEWRQSTSHLVHNASIQGSYRINLTDVDNHEPAGEKIPFAQGRLTDRYRGTLAANDADPSDFMLTWMNTDQPLEIVYEWEEPIEGNLLRLYSTGPLPAGVVESSQDGKTWSENGRWEGVASASNEAVELTAVPLVSMKAPFLRIRFEEQIRKPFSIVETDIWGPAP